jgi:hypothetical protein
MELDRYPYEDTGAVAPPEPYITDAREQVCLDGECFREGSVCFLDGIPKAAVQGLAVEVAQELREADPQEGAFARAFHKEMADADADENRARIRTLFRGPDRLDPEVQRGFTTAKERESDEDVPPWWRAQAAAVRGTFDQGDWDAAIAAMAHARGVVLAEEAAERPVPAVTEILPEVGDGQRKDGNKVRGFGLIPQAPLFELARLYQLGADKYSPRGWEKGMEYSRVIDAAYRHLGKYLSGERYDAVDGQHHLAAVAWAAFAIMEYERTHPELDDIHPKNEGLS